MGKRLRLGAKTKVVPTHAALTIDQALRVLQDARNLMGGDRCLILSLSGSEIEDASVNGMAIQIDGESKYVEVRVSHPLFAPPEHRHKGMQLYREAAYQAAECIERYSDKVLGENERAMLANEIKRICEGEVK